jgi:RNA polymerase sigma factor (sigma-70 family)
MTSQFEPRGDRSDPSLAAVIRERRGLISLAYRLLGSLSDAEDAVQETYARWYAMSAEQHKAIEVPGAWLTTACSRICLDILGSARVRRESYVGEWIPEPIPGGNTWVSALASSSAVDPAEQVTLDESISMAFLVVLESMSPAERVAFVLHDVFRYSFAEVADVVGRTPGACRQLASSARRRLQGARPPTAPSPGRPGLVQEFKDAWESQNIEALVGLLDPDATTVADGGGLASAVLDPIVGSREVARTLVGLTRRLPDLTLHQRTVNGQPGLVVKRDTSTIAVLAFAFKGDRISHIWVVRNPEKLHAWTDD